MHPSWTLISTAVTVIFLVGIVAAALWERRPVMPYVLPAVGSEFEPTMTAASENSAAEHLGFAHDATAHDGKGRLYRVRYDFWISQDCCTLAVIGGGSIASIPVDAVWLWSRTVSGEILCTTNAIGEQDISGIVQQETWPAKALLGFAMNTKIGFGKTGLLRFRLTNRCADTLKSDVPLPMRS